MTPIMTPKPLTAASPKVSRVKRAMTAPFLLWGALFLIAGFALYLVAILVLVGLLLVKPDARGWAYTIFLCSSVPTGVGLILCAFDLTLLGRKRKSSRWVEGNEAGELTESPVTVVLTAYNDEDAISVAVKDFLEHDAVKRVIVVSNNSSDRTMERAREAGAIVYDEPKPGYGQCVYRCYQEALNCTDAEIIVLCEGDCTFRARDIDKLLAYLPHAEIVNGTRIVEQLRAYNTQLNTFMYYGNFFVGKLLEIKHLGHGTFTDVGTTYKVLRRGALERLLPYLNPRINLEFNAYFLDTALRTGAIVVECPVTFHARVGISKGGNKSTRRAMITGLRMMKGIFFGWPGDAN